MNDKALDLRYPIPDAKALHLRNPISDAIGLDPRHPIPDAKDMDRGRRLVVACPLLVCWLLN